MRIGILGSGSGKPMEQLIRRFKGDMAVVVANTDCGLPGLAERHGIPAATVASEAGALAAMQKHGADTIVLRAYTRVLSPEFIKAFPGRIISTHPSLLPEFSGTAYEQTLIDVLKSGLKQSGCTVHLVDEGVDTGRILLQGSFEIAKGETVDSLREKAEALEAVLVPKALEML